MARGIRRWCHAKGPQQGLAGEATGPCQRLQQAHAPNHTSGAGRASAALPAPCNRLWCITGLASATYSVKFPVKRKSVSAKLQEIRQSVSSSGSKTRRSQTTTRVCKPVGATAQSSHCRRSMIRDQTMRYGNLSRMNCPPTRLRCSASKHLNGGGKRIFRGPRKSDGLLVKSTNWPALVRTRRPPCLRSYEAS